MPAIIGLVVLVLVFVASILYAGSAPLDVRFAAPFWFLSSITAWVFASGQKQICTTNNRCTLTACPAACDRPENVLIIGFLAMTGAFVAAPLLARRFSRAIALAPGILAWLATIAALVASPGIDYGEFTGLLAARAAAYLIFGALG